MSDDVRRTFQNAVAARRDQDYARAVELCDSILSRTGDRPDVLNLKAVVLAESGQIVRARRSILTALESIDQNASAETRSTLCIHAARILAALDLYEEAYTLAGQAANLRPSDPACAYQHARLALLCGDLDKAGELVGTCLEKFSDFGEAHILEAQIAIEAGDRKSAEGSYKAVIAGEPLHARAWAGLAEISRARPGDEWVLNGLRTIHDAGIDSERSPGDWATATFAIADAHARAGAHDRAFEYYRSANRQLAERNSWDIGIWQTRTEHTIHRATRHKQESVPSAESLPLFVVGMPRSGSSLLERMIGAHPGISTSGERESMLHIERYAESSGIESAATGVGLPDDLVLEMRALYRKGMNPREQSLWVCDKANRNFERIGLARRLFPESRIVWILRNPLDTILSCYFQDFQQGLAFTNSLDHLARMYKGHWQLMLKWIECFSENIKVVKYRDLVQEPEAVMQQLSTFLNLDFDSEMLQPHLQRGPVRTASTLQVQEPIHTAALGRWRDYEQHLGAVIAYLEKAGILNQHREALLPTNAGVAV